ncbi:MAG: hypothetical protein ABSG31_09450 [Tepidisphaeraceae bacterium]|jgi:hypothetical protein
MWQTNQVEELITVVSILDRTTLMRQFEEYPARFPVDFTREFLDRQPLDRLRHIFVAICLQTQLMPGSRIGVEDLVAS